MSPAEDLALYLENDGPLYLQTQDCYRTLLARQKRGTYDSERAVKLLQYVADAAAQKYTKKLSSRGPHGSYGSFNRSTRTEVARVMRDHFEACVKTGELNYLLEAKS